jgi:hypothetical protein
MPDNNILFSSGILISNWSIADLFVRKITSQVMIADIGTANDVELRAVAWIIDKGQIEPGIK